MSDERHGPFDPQPPKTWPDVAHNAVTWLGLVAVVLIIAWAVTR